MNRSKRSLAIAGAVTLSLLAAACGSDEDTTDATTTSSASTATTVNGAAPTSTGGSTATTKAPSNLEAELNASGATFPESFYSAAIEAFTDDNDGVTINYSGGGSGKGRQDLADQIVDFAGTDGVIKDADLAKYKGGEVLYFPTVVAPITVSYNLDVASLKLAPATIAKIFQREIKTWNDPAIAADNAGVSLPNEAITVVHRSDSSGTTENFTKFLDASVGSKGDGTWKLGAGSTVEWSPDTQAAEGNGGVAGEVKSTKGAIGYVDLSDAKETGLKFASVKNKAGKFVEPTLAATSAAAAGATVAANLTYFAGWADGDAAYPIAAQTWIIAYKKQTSQDKADALKAFLEYILTDGQKLASEVDYAPLPKVLADKAIAQLDTIAVG